MPDSEWKEKRFGSALARGRNSWLCYWTVVCINDSSATCRAYAAIANEGKILKPNLIKEVFSVFGEINQKSSPKLNQ